MSGVKMGIEGRCALFPSRLLLANTVVGEYCRKR